MLFRNKAVNLHLFFAARKMSTFTFTAKDFYTLPIDPNKPPEEKSKFDAAFQVRSIIKSICTFVY